MKKILLVSATSAAVVVVAITLALALIDWNQFKGLIVTAVNERSGRTLEIRGDLKVDWSMAPVISIHDVQLGNAEWGAAEQMLQIERLRFSIRLWELLRGRVVLPFVDLQAPQINLQRDASGRENWRFDEGVVADAALPDERTEFPILGHLTIQDGRLQFQDATRDFNFSGKLASLQGLAGQRDTLSLTAQGKLQGRAFDAQLVAGSLLDLRDEDEPYPVELSVGVDDSQLHIQGTIDRPLALRGLDMDLLAEGPDLSYISTLIGLPLPATPPYRVNARLHHGAAHWKISALSGRVGDSDISGSVELDTGAERARIDAELSSSNLDFDDLGPLIGAPPGTGRGETESAEQAAQAARLQGADKIIPQKKYDLSSLRKVDATVEFKAKRIQAPGLPLNDIAVTATLENGLLRLQPLRLGVASGELAGGIVMDARGELIRWDYDIALERLRIGELVETDLVEDMAGGTLSGAVQLRSRGNSLHEAAAASNGDISLQVAGGRLSNLMFELIGLDVAESLGLMVSDNVQSVPIRCVLADIALDNGQAKSRQLVIDSDDTLIKGELAADLGAETFQLTLKPFPKDTSLFSVRTPLQVEGSFKDMRVRPDMLRLGLRTGAAALLAGLATPAAALLAFLEPGPGGDADCTAVGETRSGAAALKTFIRREHRNAG